MPEAIMGAVWAFSWGVIAASGALGGQFWGNAVTCSLFGGMRLKNRVWKWIWSREIAEDSREIAGK
jgi:hypothetical protein